MRRRRAAGSTGSDSPTLRQDVVDPAGSSGRAGSIDPAGRARLGEPRADGGNATAPRGVDALLASPAFGTGSAPEAEAQASAPGAAQGAGRPMASGDAENPRSDIEVRRRLERLAGSVDSASNRRGRRTDVRRLTNAFGMLAIGFGIAAVVIGWYGASHSPYLYQEIPYLISGGLLGVALVVGGGVLVASATSMHRVHEAHRDTQAVLRALERMERALHGGATGPFEVRTPAPGAGPPSRHDAAASGPAVGRAVGSRTTAPAAAPILDRAATLDRQPQHLDRPEHVSQVVGR